MIKLHTDKPPSANEWVVFLGNEVAGVRANLPLSAGAWPMMASIQDTSGKFDGRRKIGRISSTKLRAWDYRKKEMPINANRRNAEDLDEICLCEPCRQNARLASFAWAGTLKGLIAARNFTDRLRAWMQLKIQNTGAMARVGWSSEDISQGRWQRKRRASWSKTE